MRQYSPNAISNSCRVHLLLLDIAIFLDSGFCYVNTRLFCGRADGKALHEMYEPPNPVKHSPRRCLTGDDYLACKARCADSLIFEDTIRP